MFDNYKEQFTKELEDIKTAGTYKEEKVISSLQGPEIEVDGKKLLNFCSNDYLGLAGSQILQDAASEGLKKYGFGMASVRFIAGTGGVHKDLERAAAKFFGQEDAILYGSCFDANTGLFETILQEGDAIFSDELNHASIIDGVRLCKAERFRYKHSDMADLERCLKEFDEKIVTSTPSQSPPYQGGEKSGGNPPQASLSVRQAWGGKKGGGEPRPRRKLIATDGVFSMDGDTAKLSQICDLAERYQAMVMVDDSHGSGVLGSTGRGSIEETGVIERIDILTSTFGKALGGASGGFTAGKKEIVEYLRQRSRPYLFSNTLTPAIAFTGLYVLQNFDKSLMERKKNLLENTKYFRQKMAELGFKLGGDGRHPITPVMLFEEKLAFEMAKELLQKGVYVRAFTYPVVPQGRARIRVQLSAGHTRAQMDGALEAFREVGKQFKIIK